MSWHPFLLGVALLLSTDADAFTMSPVSQVLAPTGSGTAGSYEVTNASAEPVAIEFWVAHLIKHVDGSEDLTQRADDDFAVFPPQLVLEPGQVRTIRVKWLGDPRPDGELSFRFMAEQIPVDLHAPDPTDTEVRGRVQLYYRYHGTLFVRPRGAKPDVEIAEVVLQNEGGAAQMRVRVHNAGTERGWIRQFVLRLEIDGTSHELTELELPALADLPVLAGGTREVVAPWPADLLQKQPSAASIAVKNKD